MKQYAALLTTILLVGCGTVPHMDKLTATTDLVPMEEMPLASPPPALLMTPPPPPPPPPVAMTAPPQIVETRVGSAPTREELAEAKMTVEKIAKKLPKKAAEVLTDVAGAAMSAAEAATTSSDVTITEYDDKGNVVKKEDEHKGSFMEFIDKLLDSMTKLIGLGTGALGLYVGFQKLRNPTVKPEST